MVDVTKQTTRFGFQKTGGSQSLEVGDYDNMLDVLDAQIVEIPHVAADFTIGTGCAFTYERPTGLRRTRITLTSVAITLAGATTSCVGNATLLTMPATSNFEISGARFNLTCVKDGTTLLSTDQPKVSLGTAVAAASDLSTSGDKNLVDAVTLAATLSAAAQGNGAATPASVFKAKGASNIINLAVGISSKATGILTVSGTVDIFWHDFGNFSSLTA